MTIQSSLLKYNSDRIEESRPLKLADIQDQHEVQG
jgi:hypothetical protein